MHKLCSQSPLPPPCPSCQVRISSRTSLSQLACARPCRHPESTIHPDTEQCEQLWCYSDCRPTKTRLPLSVFWSPSSVSCSLYYCRPTKQFSEQGPHVDKQVKRRLSLFSLA